MTLNASDPAVTSASAVPETWFVVQTCDGLCEIQPRLPQDSATEALPHWGPYPSRHKAIARRIGLIRTGKCRPT